MRARQTYDIFLFLPYMLDPPLMPTRKILSAADAYYALLPCHAVIFHASFSLTSFLECLLFLFDINAMPCHCHYFYAIILKRMRCFLLLLLFAHAMPCCQKVFHCPIFLLMLRTLLYGR